MEWVDNGEVARGLLDVDTARDGAEGVENSGNSPDNLHDMILMDSRAGRGNIPCFLIDIQMPVMNRYEAANNFCSFSRKETEAVPILAMTAAAFVEDIDFLSRTNSVQCKGYLLI